MGINYFKISLTIYYFHIIFNYNTNSVVSSNSVSLT